MLAQPRRKLDRAPITVLVVHNTSTRVLEGSPGDGGDWVPLYGDLDGSAR